MLTSRRLSLSMVLRSSWKRWNSSTSLCRAIVSLDELKGHTVTYVTDVEGNLDYWNRWVELSSVVSRCSTSQKLMLKDDCHFVYGGDVWDRGRGDLRIIRDIVNMKKEYPSRVHIILGNRDINKLRLMYELRDDFVAKDLRTYWGGTIPDNSDYKLSPTANRLRTILERTMGCPHTFEYRRSELKELGIIVEEDSEIVQGDKVAKSYLDALLPGGELSEYLQLGTIALLLGNCLFVHGGFHSHTLGWVPKPLSGGYRANTVQEWVQELKSFHELEISHLLGECDSWKRNEKEEWKSLYENESILSQPFTMTSTVARGFRRGSSELGFPTANLDMDLLTVNPLRLGLNAEMDTSTETDVCLPMGDVKPGVYVGCARIMKEKAKFYPCVFSVGWNPTYGNEAKTIEVHLLNIDIVSTLQHQEPIPSDFYGEKIEVHSLVYLRDEQKFDSIDDLVSCIDEDVYRSKGYINLLQKFLENRGTAFQRISGSEDSSFSVGNDQRGVQELTSVEPWAILGGYCSPQPGSRLIQYGMGGLKGGVRNPTVIYDNFLANGAPDVPASDVIQYLSNSGVAKVFSGHQPLGDCSTIFTATVPGSLPSNSTSTVQFVMCDTSYAKHVKWISDKFKSSEKCLQSLMKPSMTYEGHDEPFAKDVNDTRGVSTAEVLITFDKTSQDGGGASPNCLHVSICGYLSNAVKYNYVVQDFVGSSFSVYDEESSSRSTWWIKGYIDEDTGYSNDVDIKEKIFIVSKSVDRDVYNSFIGESELLSLLDKSGE